MDEALGYGADFVERSRVTVAERGPGPAAQDRGHPKSVLRELRSAGREYASAHTMQTPAIDAVTNLGRREPELEELAPSNHPVLPFYE
jgi:hypothetical protein